MSIPRRVASAAAATGVAAPGAARTALPMPAVAAAAEHPVITARRGWAPTVVDLTFAIWALTIPFGLAGRLVNGDGDLFWHIRLGDEMLRTGSLVRTDFLSFTRAGQPMVAYEWGSELLLSLAHRLAGFPGVAVLAALVIAAALALATGFLLRRGVDPLLAFLAVSAGAILTSFHWLARPHLFSLLGTALLLPLLEPGRRAHVWPAAVLFALWANIHPGFTFGLGLIGAYLLGDAAEAAAGSNRAEWLGRLRYHGALLLAAFAGSLLNPHGIRLIGHVVWLTLGGGAYLRDHTNEFRSPDFHNPAAQLFLLGLLLTIALLALSRRRPSYPRLLGILALSALALMAGRNIALYGITAFPLLALCVDADWRRLRHGAIRRARMVFVEAHRRAGGLRLAPLPAAAIVLVVLGASVAWGRVPASVDPKLFPVAAVQQARAADVRGRLFGDFIWNGYLELAWPGQRVFIDGHTDFYGEDLMRAYIDVTALEPGWRDTLRKWDISLALLQPKSRLAAELGREPGWQTWYRDSTAVLLRRTGVGSVR